MKLQNRPEIKKICKEQELRPFKIEYVSSSAGISRSLSVLLLASYFQGILTKTVDDESM